MEIQRMKTRQNDHEKNKVGRVMLPGFKAYSYSNQDSVILMSRWTKRSVVQNSPEIAYTYMKNLNLIKVPK